jgi:hypothetical protein
MSLENDNMMIQNRAGTSYVEYFIAAAAMALATLAVLNHLKSPGFVTSYEAQFDGRMQAIAGQ